MGAHPINRVVIDTNGIVSALLFDGVPAKKHGALEMRRDPALPFT